MPWVQLATSGLHLGSRDNKRRWRGDVPLVIYDVGKKRSLGWVATHMSAEAVSIAARRLIEQWV